MKAVVMAGGFGREFVSGWIRVPKPPAITTAFILSS
jgi:NDP-sugar pyrophosphorylase family protein